MMDEHIFQPGDRVHWTQTRLGRRSLLMVRCEGVVEEVEWGEIALVRTSKKAELRRVHVDRLRRMGEKSQITEFVEAVREANGRTTKDLKEHEEDV